MVTVVPGRELRFRWWPEDDEAAASDVAYVLEPDDDRTRLTVTERHVPTGRASACAGAGWTPWDGRLLAIWCRAAGPVALAQR